MRKKVFLLLIFCMYTGLYAENISIIPFTVKSGDDQIITNLFIQNRITLCFYETNGTKNVNKKLKNELTTLCKNTPKDKQNQLFILAIADCSTAKKPFINFWKIALTKQSKEIGYILYGDWSGEMRDAFHFKIDEANFCIINKHGVVIYQETGLINDLQIEKIESIILSLLNEKE